MRPPLVLTVSASDPIGASGTAADLKTFTALGVYGAAVTTMITRTTTRGTHGMHRLPASAVGDQLEDALSDLRPDATKIGALGGEGAAREVARRLRENRADLGTVVLDAVMLDLDDAALITAEGATVLAEEILPQVDVLIANVLEAGQLLGQDPATDAEELREQALALQSRGPRSVLVTGARLGGDDAVDVLVHPGGTDVLRSDRLGSAHRRGAGATLSAAVAAQYARVAEFGRSGKSDQVGDAGAQDDDITIIASAREFLASTIVNAQDWTISSAPGDGRGPVNHLITLAGT